MIGSWRRAAAALALASAIGALAPSAAQGQTPYLGVQLGGTLSTFGGSAAQLESHRGGLVAGAILGLRLGRAVALESAPAWVQKGAEGTLQGFEEPIATDLEIDYLQLPLLLRLTLPTGLAARPVLLAGGAVAFRLGCSAATAESELALTYDCAASDAAEPLAGTDWSLIGGAGVEIDLGRSALALEARYDRSLGDNGEIAGIENRAWVGSVGLRVPLGR